MGGAKEYMMELQYESHLKSLGAGKYDPPNSAFKNKSKKTQKELIKRWFLERFCDPAEVLPHVSDEGGYLYLWGGPYNPMEVIPDRFSGIASENAVEECINELIAQSGTDWAPVEEEEFEEYDDDYDIPDTPRETSLESLSAQLDGFVEIVEAIPDNQKNPTLPLIYAATIGAIEAYLYEVASKMVKEQPEFREKLIKSNAIFKDEKITIAGIYKTYETLDKKILGHFQNMVWHRWKDVEVIFKAGMNLDLDLSSQLNAPTLIRHDITHRSGKTKDGKEQSITKKVTKEMITLVRQIALDTNKKIDIALNAHLQEQPF